MPETDPIHEVIFEIVRLIPKGRVSTYGAIAAAAGLRSGARMVGFALGKCSGSKPPVPAHRVVNSSGLLTGKFHFSPPGKMELLLKKEGITVQNDKVVNFRQHFWDPMKHI